MSTSHFFKPSNSNWYPSFIVEGSSVGYVKLSLHQTHPVGDPNRKYKVLASGRDNYAYSILFENEYLADHCFTTLAKMETIDIEFLESKGFTFD